jgi:hypothetical protein
MKRIRTHWRGRSGIVLVLIGLGFCGCGSKTGTVSGKVLYQGQTLSYGLVIFVASDGKVSPPAGIEVDGTYAAHDVPVGPVKVCVEVLPLLGGDGGGAKDRPRPRYVPVPLKYKDAQQTDLTLDVKPGANVYNIELH